MGFTYDWATKNDRNQRGRRDARVSPCADDALVVRSSTLIRRGTNSMQDRFDWRYVSGLFTSLCTFWQCHSTYKRLDVAIIDQIALNVTRNVPRSLRHVHLFRDAIGLFENDNREDTGRMGRGHQPWPISASHCIRHFGFTTSQRLLRLEQPLIE